MQRDWQDQEGITYDTNSYEVYMICEDKRVWYGMEKKILQNNTTELIKDMENDRMDSLKKNY